MTEAHALYRSLGFTDAAPFEVESARSRIDALALFTERRLAD